MYLKQLEGTTKLAPVPNHLSARAASTSAAARKGVALASHEAETERGPERALVQNQHTRELISARNTSHKYNNKDPSRLR